MKPSAKIDFNRDALYFSLTNDFQAQLAQRSEIMKSINLQKASENNQNAKENHDSQQKEAEIKLQQPNWGDEITKLEVQMTETKRQFKLYMEDHLKKYKDDERDLKKIHFSGKIGSDLIEIIKKISDELSLPSLKEGKNIYVNRPQNISTTNWQDEINQSESPSAIPSKPPISSPEQPSPSLLPPLTVVSPSPPEEQYLFKPDQIEKFEITSLENSSISFEITPPDDNGAKITQYNLHIKQPELEKYIKFFSSPKESFELPFHMIPFIQNHQKGSKIFLNLSITAQNSLGESPPLLIRLLFRLPRQGTLWVMGENKQNRLGLGEEIERVNNLQAISLFPSCVSKIASSRSTLVLLDSGAFAQCGASIESSEIDIKEEDYETKIEIIPSVFFYPMEKLIVQDLACGGDFCMVVTIGKTEKLNYYSIYLLVGKVFSWGLNRFGQLGISTTSARTYPSPILLPSSHKNIFFKQVAAGDHHALGLTVEGEMFSWGRWQALGGIPIMNRFEEVIGFGNCRENQLQPRKVDIYGEKVTRILTGCDFSLALTESSQLYSWGCSSMGQLGHSDNEFDLVAPRIIELLEEEKKNDHSEKTGKRRILDVGVGGRSVYVLAEEEGKKEIWGWGGIGNKELGQLIIRKPRVIRNGDGFEWIVGGRGGALMGGIEVKMEGLGKGEKVREEIERVRGKVVGGRKCWWVLETKEEVDVNKVDC